MTDEIQKITPAEWHALTCRNIDTMRANNAWMSSRGYRTPPEDTEGEAMFLEGFTQPTGGSN